MPPAETGAAAFVVVTFLGLRRALPLLGGARRRYAGSSLSDGRSREVAARIMQDLRSRDLHYLSRDSLTERLQKNDSEHRAYVFMVSTRDLARFGLRRPSGGRRPA